MVSSKVMDEVEEQVEVVSPTPATTEAEELLLELSHVETDEVQGPNICLDNSRSFSTSTGGKEGTSGAGRLGCVVKPDCGGTILTVGITLEE